MLKKCLEDLHQNSEKVKYTDMINTVVVYSYSTDEFVQVFIIDIFLSIFQLQLKLYLFVFLVYSYMLD